MAVCSRCRHDAPTTELELTTLYPPDSQGNRLVSSLSVQHLCATCMVALNRWLAGARERREVLDEAIVENARVRLKALRDQEEA